MPPDDDGIEGLGAVPPWVLRVVRDLAETKKGVGILEASMILLNTKIETFVTRNEYGERHGEVVHRIDEIESKRIDPLWDAHNTLKGEIQAQNRTSNVLRWVFGLAITALAAWAALRSAHVL